MDADGESPRAYEDPVARWVADGLRDAEIAVRLGVSVGEARTRRYRLTESPAPRLEAVLPPLLPPVAEAPQPGTMRGPAKLRFAPAALAVMAAIAAGWWVMQAEESGERAPITGAPGALSLVRSPQPDVIRPGPPIEFPADLSLVLRTGGDGDHGPRALQRIYRDVGGILHQETLLTAPDGATVGRVVSDSDGFALVAAIHTADSTSFVRSADGGVTWEEIGARPGYLEPVGIYEGEAVVWRDTGDGLGLFTRLPSGLGFMPPYPGGKPVAMLARGKLLWRVPDTGAIAETDGAPYLAPDIDPTSYYGWLAPQPTGAGTMVQWDGPALFTGEQQSFVGILNSAGQVTQEWSGLPGPVAGRTDGATLIVVAPATGPGEPRDSMAVLVELQENRWRPLVTGFSLISSPDPRFIASVRRGPFVRVQQRGECAPVRATSQRDAEIISCVRNGVLLRAPGEVRVHVDRTWRQVITPTGRSGWIDIGQLSAVDSAASDALSLR